MDVVAIDVCLKYVVNVDGRSCYYLFGGGLLMVLVIQRVVLGGEQL